MSLRRTLMAATSCFVIVCARWNAFGTIQITANDEEQ